MLGAGLAIASSWKRHREEAAQRDNLLPTPRTLPPVRAKGAHRTRGRPPPARPPPQFAGTGFAAARTPRSTATILVIARSFAAERVRLAAWPDEIAADFGDDR